MITYEAIIDLQRKIDINTKIKRAEKLNKNIMSIKVIILI